MRKKEVVGMLAQEFKVREFMSREVLNVPCDIVVANAVKVMADHNVGCVAVTEGKRTVGLLTEWDLLRALPRQGLYPEPSLVKSVMKPSHVVVTPEDTLTEAAGAMIQGKGRLTVFHEGELVGIVTATDLVRQIAMTHNGFSIERLVSRNVVTVGYHTTVGLAIQHMVEKRIGSVLIYKPTSVYGIFTERDALLKVISPSLRLNAKVGELASFPLMTAAAEIDGPDAARIMTQHKIKKLPLFRDDKIFGILTARDVVQAYAESMRSHG